MNALEEAAREIGVALGECGADPTSPVVGEVAGLLAELSDEPPPRRSPWRFFPRRRGGGPSAPPARRAD